MAGFKLKFARMGLVVGCLAACAAITIPSMPFARSDDPKDESVKVQRAAAGILERHCVECHGGKATRSGLNLTTREGLLKGGESGAIVEAGKAKESRLLALVKHTAEPGMPFRRKKLNDDQIATLTAWIDGGAGYGGVLKQQGNSGEEIWWSLKPVVKPAIPMGFKGRNAIDNFVLVKLLEKGLAPAPEADKWTLLRRVMVDLIGLPPTTEETAAFLADESPDAYGKLVDKLLASPQYGERWARHWMDTVHYAETHGHDQDRPRPNAWPYRDYLIRAFNEDKPYARFAEEQLAGDVLFPDDPQAIAAMGFLATGPWDESSLRDIRDDTIDREIARYLDRDDMVTTAMNTLVSTTVQCARCHEHKFDPVSQEEYYRLQAVFAGVGKGDRAFDADPVVGKARKALFARKTELPKLAEKADASLLTESVQSGVSAWEKKVAENVSPWVVVDVETVTAANGATLTKQADGSVLSGGTRPEKETYTVISTPRGKITGVRVDVLTDDSLPHKGPGRQDNGNLHLNEFSVVALPAGTTDLSAGKAVKLANPRADFNQAGWSIEMALDGNPATAWGIYPEVGKPHVAVFEVAEPIELPEGSKLAFKLEQIHGGGHLIGRVRLSVTNAPLPLPLQQETLPAPITAILKTPNAERTDKQRAELAAFVQLEQLERELAALPARQKVYVAANDFEPNGGFKPSDGPRMVHVLKRGDISKPANVAEPGALSCMEGVPAKFALSNPGDEGSRRVALAKWVTDPKNSLTWRSIVNRVWHYHFGRGIVDTPNDFGRMGGQPTHPELLDWLAATFLESGGSFKKLHRLIVTSATYRQSSRHDQKFAEIDGDNRFLWRMNRARLDAESIRDAVLRISGKLDPTMGGPSVKQFIETPGIHVTPNVDYLNFDVDKPENYRRSVYRFIFRTLPDPFMETLDCADASQLTPVRSTSLTALQALTMLNNKFMVRQSEHIAEKVTKQASDLPGQVRAAYELILGRAPTAKEAELIGRHATTFGWANAVRVLLNSNEFMFVN